MIHIPLPLPLPLLSLLSWLTGLTRTRCGGGRTEGDIIERDLNRVPSSPECYACTQGGIPAFHSTTCDRVHRPQWEASAGSSLFTIGSKFGNLIGTRVRNSSSRILDPRTALVQRWNRGVLLARCVALAVDPLFFYALSLVVLESGAPCVYVDGGFAAVVTVFRTCVDMVHISHVWFQFRLAYVSRASLVVGCGKLVWDARAIAYHYVRSLRGFWLDVFVILPVPQAVFWLVIPKLIKEEKFKLMMTMLLLIFLFQFLPKVYHGLYLMRKMRKVTGYVFGTVWWGFSINLVAYLISSHIIGGCWYILATGRVFSCLKQHYEQNMHYNLNLCSCSNAYNQFLSPTKLLQGSFVSNITKLKTSICLDEDGPFNYGIYEPVLEVISSNSLATRILYPIYWGLINLSSFGNVLIPTSKLDEVIFSIFIVLCGLLLFTLLVGNIQIFLQVVTMKKEQMQLRRSDIEWWMRRRQLPYNLRQRVRHYESHKWEVIGGQEEVKWIEELPDGLRKDIKRYLCLDLIKQVPLFHNLDDLILDNICDRVEPLIFSKDEKIIKEGDPVQKMMFIVCGRVKRSQRLSKDTVVSNILETGGFLGDELLSWCLRHPSMERLPPASATFVSLHSTEVFALDFKQLQFITDHFRYSFANGRIKRIARYYSSNWRTWAAITIQLAWQRYKRTTASLLIPPVPVLRQYAAIFMSVKPHDHLE